MKFKEDILSQLRLLGRDHLFYRHPYQPILQTGYSLAEVKRGEEQKADLEFGWNGLQSFCTHPYMMSAISEKEGKGYALEGLGYVGMRQSLFEDFDRTNIIALLQDKDGCSKLTSFIASSVAATATEDSGLIWVTVAQSDYASPPDCVTLQLAIVATCTEEAWMAMYTIQTKSLVAATKYFKELYGEEATKMLTQSDQERSLN